MSAPWWKLPICWLGYCGHKAVCDDTGCWGECVTCGKRAGFVSRDILRTAADREYAAWLRGHGDPSRPVSLADLASATAYGADDGPTPGTSKTSTPGPTK